MDNYHLGDLADIVGSVFGNTTIATTTSTSTITTPTEEQMPNWQFGPSDATTSNNQQPYQQLKDFYTFPDPLLHEMDAISSPGPLLDMGSEENSMRGSVFSSTSGPMQLPATPVPNTTFSMFTPRMVQISPDSNNNSKNNTSKNKVKLPILAVSPRGIKRGFGFMSNDEMMSINASCSTSPKDGFVSGTTGVQIPSPRNPGMKRRKTQAKKVVCIPAPAAANSRQTGEVVPSDLWAWRKYGQKPIKGSPYPRGYYRCSSSKGCSARKQVERSRTDPNMLVITYTSEHNHPWPTQRNALAGSTRAQPSKNSNEAGSQAQSDNHLLSPSQSEEGVLVKDEIAKDVSHLSDVERTMANHNNASGCTSTSSIKEEEPRFDEQVEHKAQEFIVDVQDNHQFSNNYRPMIMPEVDSHQQPNQDFFADLVEFEGDDPLNLLFTQQTKGSDPFSSLFDWPSNTTTHTNTENNDHTNTSASREVEGDS